jgi:hypothetical protein
MRLDTRSLQREIVITASRDTGRPSNQYGGVLMNLANKLGDTTATIRSIRVLHVSRHPVATN